MSNFHCNYVSDRLCFSNSFGYLDYSNRLKESKYQNTDGKKLIIFEFIIIKNLIFYGLLFKSQELFR